MAKMVIRNLPLDEIIEFLQKVLKLSSVADMYVDDEANTVLFRPVDYVPEKEKTLKITDQNINDLI